MRKDNQLIVITHLTQLLDYVTGFGGLVVPLILWLTQRDRVEEMDEHGKAILNFQISILIYAIISIPLILAFGLGILMLIVVAIVAFIFPIVNAVKASRGELPNYPFSINIIK